MKLSARGRYAVMALVDICLFERRDQPRIPHSLAIIAQNQGISLAYLEQIFMKLKKKGIVTSIRGITGGYCLASSPEVLTLADIFDSVDETFTATACHSGKVAECIPSRGRCAVHHVWMDLEIKVHAYLQSITLASIVESIKKGEGAENLVPGPSLGLMGHERRTSEGSVYLGKGITV